MTSREEEIKKAVQEFREERKTAVGRAKRGGWYFADIFEEGIKWADNHPRSLWISVEEDLPCNHEELILLYSTRKVLVLTDKGHVDLSKMKKSDRQTVVNKPWWTWETSDNVRFWMPIPEMPED